MKLADIKVGEVYGALDHPTGRYRDNNPRPVKVLEIVVREEKKHNRYTSVWTVTKKKYVLVQATEKVLTGGYRLRGIDSIDKDATMTIEARNLVGLWSEISGPILERIESQRLAQVHQEEMDARLAMLNLEDVATYSKDGRGWQPELRFSGADVIERVLEVLEGAKEDVS